jgi:hypothetical protein
MIYSGFSHFLTAGWIFNELGMVTMPFEPTHSHTLSVPTTDNANMVVCTSKVGATLAPHNVSY